MPAATLQISFAEPTTRVLIRLEAGRSFDNTIPFWVMPANPDVVRVTVGNYLSVGNRTIQVRGETIKFEQSERAQLRYPGVTSAAVTGLEDAIFRSSDGSSISPNWTFDELAGEIIALDPATGGPVSIFGGASVDYTISYSRYIYEPFTDDSGGVFLTAYGSIFAMKNRVGDTLSIDAGLADDRQYAELYHVYSNVVIANSTTSVRDVWELPPNYPQSGDFPVGSGPDPNNSVAVERVHEIGYLTKSGFQKNEIFRHPKEKPYAGAGDAFYTPNFTLRWQSAPDDSFTEAFADVDQSAIRADLAGRYPGIS